MREICIFKPHALIVLKYAILREESLLCIKDLFSD